MNHKTPKSNLLFLSNGGEMGELIRQKDWRNSLVGVPEKWSQILRTALSIILHSKFPMFLFWGPELICFYNDAYRPILGDNGKHPDILGGRAENYWQEIWGTIKPIIDQVLAGGEANWSEDQLFPIYRNGTLEDVYATFSYSPIYDESGKPAGVLVTCTETTKQVTSLKNLQESEERFRTLADNMSQFAWMADETSGIYWYNQRWYDYSGTTLEDMKGLGWQKLHHPDHLERVIKSKQHSWNLGEIWEDTFPLRGKDGQYRWFLSRAIPIKDADGKVVRWFGTNTDVTEQNGLIEKLNETVSKLNLNEKERKIVEKKIRESEELLRVAKDQLELTFANVPAAIFLYNHKKEILFANQKAAHLLGYDTVEKLLEEKYYDILMEKGGENYYVKDENNEPFLSENLPSVNALKLGQHGEVVFSMERRSGGEKVWLLNKSAPILDENGNVSMVLTTSTDITVQKVFLEKLKESEENFRQLSDLMPEKVSKSDAYGNVIYYNRSWLDYTGSSFEDLKNWGWAQFIHPDDVEELTRLWTHSVTTAESFEMEFRILDKAGQYKWHLCRSSAIKDAEGTIKNWVGVTIDIEQQKSFTRELEQQVRVRTNELKTANKMLLEKNELLTASENFNRTLTEVSPSMVYIRDIEKNKPVFLNSSYLKFVGYTWEEVEKLGDEFFNLVVHPDDIHFLGEVTAKIKASKLGDVFETNSRRKNAQGNWVPFLNRLTAFKRNSKNEVTQIIGVATDISDLKKAKDVLRQKNQDLENTNKELQSFAYISSHDLQEPLRKIQTFANRIVEKEFNNLSDTGKSYVKKVEEAANRMRTLIDDLLAYSRTNMQERKFEKTNLGEIIEDVRLEFAEELDKKQAIFEATVFCESNVIPFQMRQLVQNLISNALKFANPKRRLHIKIKTETAKGAKFHNTNLDSQKEYCHIHISDNGIGFDQIYGEKIFEVFQRLHGKEKYSGTGIGLSIVKKIVDNHDGVITAKGELDKGATFDIYIPFN